jgi:hypothetical protein
MDDLDGRETFKLGGLDHAGQYFMGTVRSGLEADGSTRILITQYWKQHMYGLHSLYYNNNPELERKLSVSL